TVPSVACCAAGRLPAKPRGCRHGTGERAMSLERQTECASRANGEHARRNSSIRSAIAFAHVRHEYHPRPGFARNADKNLHGHLRARLLSLIMKIIINWNGEVRQAN